MTQKTTSPFLLKQYVHVILREPYSWEEPNHPESGAMIEAYIRPDSGKMALHGSRELLYCDQIRIHIPAFDPVEKRLAAIEREMHSNREAYLQAQKTLEETRQRLLSLPAPGGDDFIPRDSGDFDDSVPF